MKRGDDLSGALFDLKEYASTDPKLKTSTKGHVWTDNKAQLISRYLRSFTYVTKHGTYLDAFAGPQSEEATAKGWAARLALENEPKWMKKFCLFELTSSQIGFLTELAAQHHEGWNRKTERKVVVIQGDSNAELPKYLADNPIGAKEAAFCLLDQRTKECTWSLVEKVALHKKEGFKVELFYFLAQGWIDRVLTDKLGESNIQEVKKWWGREDWRAFKDMSTNERGACFAERFKEDLGYAYSRAFPIFERGSEGRIMFWMIHASDHPRALPLMAAAYSGVGLSLPESTAEQLKML